MVVTETEIFGKVQRDVADALGVDQQQVTSDARLTQDLGAESIDYLDIAFRLERTFGIKFEPSEMAPGNLASDGRFVQDGSITNAGMHELRERFPHANFDLLQRTRDVGDFTTIFTVDTLVRFVTTKLGQRDHRC